MTSPTVPTPEDSIAEILANVNPRGKFDLVGHIRMPDFAKGPAHLGIARNLIIRFDEDSPHKWIEFTLEQLGDWRAELRSTYIRWALAINAVVEAANLYEAKSEAKSEDTMFLVKTLRHTGVATLKSMNFKEAARSHLKTQPMLVAYGFIDMYACLEETILRMFRTYWTHNPAKMLTGRDHSDARALFRESKTDDAARARWQEFWTKRLDKWQQEKIYQGLDRVFIGYINTTGLKGPSVYKETTPETWAQSIKQISLIRNALTHGVMSVTEEIESACNRRWLSNFTFKKGDPLTLRLDHLMAVECFCDALLTALNICMIELVYGPMDKLARRTHTAGTER